MADETHYLRDKRPSRFALVRPLLPDGQRGLACTGAHLCDYFDHSGPDGLMWERVSPREWLKDQLLEAIAKRFGRRAHR